MLSAAPKKDGESQIKATDDNSSASVALLRFALSVTDTDAVVLLAADGLCLGLVRHTRTTVVPLPEILAGLRLLPRDFRRVLHVGELLPASTNAALYEIFPRTAGVIVLEAPGENEATDRLLLLYAPENLPDPDISPSQYDVFTGLAAQVATTLALTRAQYREAALRKSERQYREIAEVSPSGLFQTTATGNCTYVSERWCSIVGLSRQEAMGYGWLEAVHPEDRERVQKEWAEAAQRGALFETEYRFVQPTGETVWVMGQVAPKLGVDGTFTGYTGAITDISDRKHMESILRDSEARLQRMAANILGVVYQFALHTDGRITFPFVGASAPVVLGFTPEELRADASPILNYIHPDDRQGFLSSVEVSARDTTPWQWEGRFFHRRTGALLWMRAASRPEKQPNGDVLWDGIMMDITRHKDLEDAVRRQAELDALTALPNRDWFHRHLAEGIALAEKERYDLAVLYLDLNGFKHVNDTLGHHIGDALLCIVAERLRASVPEGVLLARMGGDEFTAIVPSPAALGKRGRALSWQSLSQLAERILSCFGEPVPLHGHELFITASLGISVFPYDGQDAQTLLRHADVAMYRAKEQGSNTYQRHSEAMNVVAYDRLLLESSLRRAVIDMSGMSVYYQPRVSLRSGEIIGVEALLRWRHPDGRMLPPQRFITLAEETGMIRPLGEWVLRQACRQASEWIRMGRSLRVSVNLSARQIGQPGLANVVRECLAESGLPPSWLELELTETALIKNGEAAVAFLNELKSMGVRLSVDDFGTGYSSLSYLRRFPLDVVKIDRSFVAELTEDPRTQAIVRAIVDLAHALSLGVVAEGVETEEQRDLVTRLGCDGMQGFLFSEAVPADTVTAMLKS